MKYQITANKKKPTGRMHGYLKKKNKKHNRKLCNEKLAFLLLSPT